MKKLGFSIPGSKTLPIRGDIYVPEGSGAFPVLIFCHGFKGFKIGVLFPTFLKKFLVLVLFVFHLTSLIMELVKIQSSLQN